MWVLQAGESSRRDTLINVNNGNVIRLVPTADEYRSERGQEVSSVIGLFQAGVRVNPLPLYTGTLEQCLAAFNSLERQINDGQAAIWSYYGPAIS